MIRVTVDNDGAENWRGALLALESRDHPQDETADTTAKLVYEAEDLTPLGDAAVATRTGASGGAQDNVVRATLNGFWSTILSSEIDGVGHMTHRGARRMKFRVYDPGDEAGLVELRLEWRALGAARRTPGPIVATPLVDNFALVDLGEARPQDAVRGDRRWEWRLTARKTTGAAATIDIDLAYPLPTEQLLVVSEPIGAQSTGLGQGPRSPGTVVDDGGGDVAWTNPGNAASSDDSRATAVLNGTGAGDWVTARLKATDFGFTIPADAVITAIVVEVEHSATAADSILTFVQLVKAGATLLPPAHGGFAPTTDAYEIFQGSHPLWGKPWTPADINDSGFGASFKATINEAGAVTERADHIRIVVAYAEETEDRVAFQGRSVEFRTDGVYRQHATDDVWGRLVPDGFLPYGPPSGLEGRAMRGILIPSQGDFQELPDSGDNPSSLQVFYHPAYHFASEGAGQE